MKRVTGVIGRHRVLSGIVVLVAAVGGVFVFRQVEPIVVAQFDDVSFAVPKAPELTAKSGEQLFRIDPKLSKASYSIEEEFAGKSTGTAKKRWSHQAR